jgi:hypothetical protein
MLTTEQVGVAVLAFCHGFAEVAEPVSLALVVQQYGSPG